MKNKPLDHLTIQSYIDQIVMPKPGSRKGENGRVLVIGGSKLFHAASFWSATMASKIVDMVHFSSPTIENNELMRVRAKELFWDGIVVDWSDIDHYIEEDDCILIGPGMERGSETKKIVNALLAKYPNKRWVVDGGALQEVDPNLLNTNMIVTPNYKEMEILIQKPGISMLELVGKQGVTVLAKGEVDVITSVSGRVEVEGGSPGMTKGGTGDVLAGLVAALYSKSPAMAACIVASQANKCAGEELEKTMGPFFSALDMIPQVQKELGNVLGEFK